MPNVKVYTIYDSWLLGTCIVFGLALLVVIVIGARNTKSDNDRLAGLKSDHTQTVQAVQKKLEWKRTEQQMLVNRIFYIQDKRPKEPVCYSVLKNTFYYQSREISSYSQAPVPCALVADLLPK